MNRSVFTRKLKFAALAALGLAASAISAVPAASASSYSNAAAINRIINGLDPAGWSYKGGYAGRHHSGSRYGYYGKSHHGYYGYGHQPLYSGTYSYEYAAPYVYENDYSDLDESVYNRTLNLSVWFATGSARITWRAKRTLDNLGYALTSPRLADAVYRIAGHTDARGDRHANRILSIKRARAVKRYLVQKFDIDPRRLIAVGFGEDRLKDSYRPSSSVNRRVEVTLIANSYADLSDGPYGTQQ